MQTVEFRSRHSLTVHVEISTSMEETTCSPVDENNSLSPIEPTIHSASLVLVELSCQ